MSADKLIEETLVIGERSVPYITRKFAFEDAIELQAEVLQLIGTTADFSRGIGSVFAGLGTAILQRGGANFVYRLLKRTIRDGVKLDKPEAVRAAYEDNLGEMVIALEWVIRLNFASFFEEGVRDVVRKRILAPLMKVLASDGPDASWMRSVATGVSTSSPPSSGNP